MVILGAAVGTTATRHSQDGYVPATSTTCRCQGLIEVGEDVGDVFYPDAETDKVRGDAAGQLGGLVELAVGGAGAMDGQALGVPYVGDVGE